MCCRFFSHTTIIHHLLLIIHFPMHMKMGKYMILYQSDKVGIGGIRVLLHPSDKKSLIKKLKNTAL